MQSDNIHFQSSTIDVIQKAAEFMLIINFKSIILYSLLVL